MDRISFLKGIAKELNIKKGIVETESSWIHRVIYSAIAKVALASLYDKTEEDDEYKGSVSITYFKRKVEELQRAYSDLFPEELQDLPPLNDYFYDLFLKNGYLYHTSNWIYPVRAKIINAGTVSFIRGDCFNSKIVMSGTGLYCINSKKSEVNYSNIFEAFLFTGNYKNYIDNLIAEANWKEFEINEDIEYLKIKPPFTSGYWKGKPDKTGISLLKISNNINKIYYLYKYENDVCYVSSLPKWAVEGIEYIRIARALMLRNGYSLEPSIVKKDNEIVQVNLNYLLPPAEMNFFKLYSWPEKWVSDYDQFAKENNVFKRVMQIDVYNEFYNILKASGLFKE